MRLRRFDGNPILAPNPDNPWENLAVFNPGAWYDEDRGEVFLLYRSAESHREYKCYFGLATSRDGYHFERVSDRPVLSPSEDGNDAADDRGFDTSRMGEHAYRLVAQSGLVRACPGASQPGTNGCLVAVLAFYFDFIDQRNP